MMLTISTEPKNCDRSEIPEADYRLEDLQRKLWSWLIPCLLSRVEELRERKRGMGAVTAELLPRRQGRAALLTLAGWSSGRVNCSLSNVWKK